MSVCGFLSEEQTRVVGRKDMMETWSLSTGGVRVQWVRDTESQQEPCCALASFHGGALRDSFRNEWKKTLNEDRPTLHG